MLIIILILGVVIFVHELGHLIACKLTKVYVEEFALGMGPKLFSRKIGETEYSLRAFPIGGFNRIKGEEFEKENQMDDDPRSLSNQTPGVKLFIILSGVFMNFLLAIAIFYFILISMSFKFTIDSSFDDFDPVFGQVGQEVFQEEVKYSGLVEGGQAETFGLPEKGTIKSINEQDLVLSSDVIEIVRSNVGKEIVLEICNDECQMYTIEVSEDGMVGILLFSNYYSYLEYTGWERPFVGFLHVLNWGQIFRIALDDLFTEAEETGDYEKVAMSVSGPVGLYVVIDHLRGFGWEPLVGITADISLTIAIVNLLPIPALDGGRAVMAMTEFVSRRPINRKFESWAIQISFILLLLLMVAVLLKDVIYFEKLQDLFN